MEEWTSIRERILVNKESKRSILRETGMHWTTLEKILNNSQPPGYQITEPRRRRKLAAYETRINEILEADKQAPKKQRHTAIRLFDRLKEEGYEGGYSVLCEYLRDLKKKRQEVFVPLSQRPGEAQVDFGHALAKIDGILTKVSYFVMSLPYSDAFYVMCSQRECTESFWEGHVRAFEFFGGVPRRISYDNSRIAVIEIMLKRQRRLTDAFLQLKSHYLFKEHFCHVRRPNEKGVVEGIVKYARSRFMVPVPSFKSVEALNSYLKGQCLEDMKRRVRGQVAIKKILLEQEREHFLSLPVAPFDACRKESVFSSSLSLARFNNNDYSVPVQYAHHQVLVKGYYEKIVICHKNEVIARHKRIWEKERISFDPIHYLALLEKKPGALDYARPLEQWGLPECFHLLRRRLESKYSDRGTREYIKVLRLLEKYSLARLRKAVEQGLQVGAITCDGVVQFLYGNQQWDNNIVLFSLDGYPQLQGVKVFSPQLKEYNQLLQVGGEL